MQVEKEKQPSFLSQYKGFVAGSIGGIAQVLTGQPFDIVKVRLQATNDSSVTAQGILKKLWEKEGFFGFYKGTSAPLVMISVQVSVQFGVFERMKSVFLKNKDDKLSIQQLMICSGVAGYFQSFVSSPIEHIRIKMQTAQAGKYNGAVDCFSKIYKSNGIKGVYKGLVATQFRDVFGNIFYFMAYNKTVDYLTSLNYGSQYLTAYQLLGGALAGLACWGGSIQFDVIKSRMQADSISNPKYTGFLDCSKKTFQELGVQGFLKGIVPCLVRSVFVNAATFGVFEQAKKQLEKYE